MTDLPSPFLPAEVDLRDFPFLPLDVVRLRDSELAASVSGEEFRAAVLLWCASWHQIPAGSLPDDDVQLSTLAGFGRVVKEWKRHRKGALHGWIKCSDGRLYHCVVAEKAREAWNEKLAQRWRTECARIRKHNERHQDKLSTPTLEEWLSQRQPQQVTRDNEEKSHGHEANSHTDKDEMSRGSPANVGSKGQGQGQGQGLIDNSQQCSPTISDPGGAVQAEYDLLEHRLREAAGLLSNPSPSLRIIGPISDLVEEGYDLDRHILPVLRAKAAAKKFGRSWGFYTEAIREARQKTGAVPFQPVPSGSASTDPRMIEGHPKELIFDLTCGFAMPLRNLASALKMLRERDFWAAPSPRPGQPGCRIPDEFLPEDLRQSNQNVSKNEQILSGSER